MSRDTGPLFPPTLMAVFRRPTCSGPKGRVDALFGTRMGYIALFVVTVNEGLIQPDILALVLLK
jgi:hypothetical protein